MSEVMSTSIEGKIEKLKKYFEKRDDVVMAFLLGSQARGETQTHEHSDWDLAVYFTPRIKSLEWEEDAQDYPGENEIWSACADLLHTDNIDVLVLNRVPVSIAQAAMEGRMLVVKNYSLWSRFVRVISDAAEEYHRFVNEFYMISQRLQSLTLRDREDLQKTIDFVEEQLRLTTLYRQFTKEEFEAEPRKRNEIERWLENMVNAVIDISKVILGSKKTLIPST